MPKVIDMTNQKINRLLVLERVENTKNGQAQWKCLCDCGSIVIVTGINLRNGHTKSCGCYQRDRTSEACRIDRVGETIGNFTLLEYYQKDYNNEERSKWRCRCNLCGNDQVYLPTNNMWKQYSCGCSIESKGEKKVKELLEQNNIQYIQEKRFCDLVFEDTKKKARFDFFLPELNCIIEYDGVQHFKQGKGVYDNLNKFNRTKEHDRLKEQYCKDNNIILIRIPYTHYDNIVIEDLLPLSSNFIVS